MSHGSTPVVLDSSGWVEYLRDGPNASEFAKALENEREVLVPEVAFAEIVRYVRRTAGEDAMLRVAAQLRQHTTIPLDTTVSLDAARLALKHRLPFAGSLILASARARDAELWTQDADFDGLPSVRYVAPR